MQFHFITKISNFLSDECKKNLSNLNHLKMYDFPYIIINTWGNHQSSGWLGASARRQCSPQGYIYSPSKSYRLHNTRPFMVIKVKCWLSFSLCNCCEKGYKILFFYQFKRLILSNCMQKVINFFCDEFCTNNGVNLHNVTIIQNGNMEWYFLRL